MERVVGRTSPLRPLRSQRLSQRMRERLLSSAPTSGETGPSCAPGTACTCGTSSVPWELSGVSNGWFRLLLDNKLATMYSSGSTEGGPDSFGGWSLLTVLWCRYNTEPGFVTIHDVSSVLLAPPPAENRWSSWRSCSECVDRSRQALGVQPVLSSPSPARLTVGNWSLACQREGEVSLHNANGTRVGGAPSCTAALIVCYGRQSCRWWYSLSLSDDSSELC